jgi:hypothetical protein
LQSPPSSPEPTQPTFNAPVAHTLPPQERDDERTMTAASLMNVHSRLTNLTKKPIASALPHRPLSTSTSSSTNGPPSIPASSRPAVSRTTRPTNRADTRRFTAPSPFFTKEADDSWTPSLPYAYMPHAGRKVTEGQCSAAQLCSYFAESVPWGKSLLYFFVYS